MSQKQASSEKPPVIQIGPIRWLQENLFNSWLNAFLTLVSSIILYLFLSNILNWVFFDANWAVIPAGIKLLLVGTYPDEQLWRVWGALYMVAFFLGISGGMHKKLIRQIAFTIGIASIAVAALPIPLATRGWAIGVAIAMAIGYGLGFLLRGKKLGIRLETTLWILSFPLTIILLKGIDLTLNLGGEMVTILPSVEQWSLWGFMLNILGAAVGIALSFPVGILLALGRKSKLPVVRLICTLYIEIIRGMPLIALLFIASNLLPLIVPQTFRLDIVIRAMITITAFSAAYMAENVRGGLQSIPVGQSEAAYAIGLNGFLTTRLIVLPQALRAVIPAIVGQFISLFKDTTLFGFVAVLEILGMGRAILGNAEWRGLIFEILIFVAFIFWIFCYSLSYVSRRIEKDLGVGER
jgi:general L-amino acid transport system permease protein